MVPIRKITIKTCGDFTVKRIKEVMEAAKLEDGKSVPLLKIAGMSSGASVGQTDKGQFTKLSGSFVGTDMTTGELYQSGVCILPEFIGAQIGAAILQSKNPVQFAFQIEAKRKDNSITGYEFVVRPLIESKPTDAMADLMKLAGIAPKVAALPAPESAPIPDAPGPAAPPAPAKPAKPGK